MESMSKMRKLVFLLLVSSFLTILAFTTLQSQDLERGSHNHQCRLWGMMANPLPEDVTLDHLLNLPYSLKNLGAINSDGWGLAYYNQTEPVVLRGESPANTDPNFDLAAHELAKAKLG